jgi:hypothetical protein
MSFFSEASLAMIPSGYKTSKVYSALPITGDGDLTFSRSNDTATRVGPDGLIEKVRTNLALRSQEFATSAVWSTVSGTITNNAGTAPDGTNTASKIVATDSDPYCYQPLTLSGQVAISCYVKGIGSSIGKTGSIRGGTTYYNFTITGDWQRVLVAHTAAGAQNYGIETPESAAVSDEVLLWGFQVETGDIATDYIATTTAAVTVGPVANVPRLDYLDSSFPRLLLEPQRTNTALYSEQTDNAYWTKFQATITANQAVSPDGTMSADRITTTGADALIYRTAMAAGALSFFIKAETLSAAARFHITVDGVGSATWNQNGTLFQVSGGTATAATDYGNGWYRCNFNVTSGAVINYGLTNATIGNTAFIWGIQNEASATYPSSYIGPTLGAAVTRGADAASKTSASALIGQTEGTLFLEFDFVSGVNANYGIIYQSGFATYIYINQQTAGSISGQIQGVGGINFSVAKPNGRYKCALAYKSGDSAFFVNGVQVGTTNTTTFTPAAMDLFSFSVGTETNTNNQALLFPTRLSNSQLAELTA